MSVTARAITIAAIAALALTAGCSVDSADTASGPSSSATPTIAPRTVAACTALLAVDSNPADPDSPEFAIAAKKIATDLASVAAGTDGAVSAAATLGGEALGKYAADQSLPDPTRDPEVAKAIVTVNKWGYDTCGYSHIDMTATEMTSGGSTMRMYSGLPATLTAGKYALALNNTSDEAHIVVILRKKPGVTEDTATLLAKPDNEVFASVDIVAGDAGAAPKQTGYLVTDLTPGNYIFFCPIPDSTGKPHYETGMHSDVTVS